MGKVVSTRHFRATIKRGSHFIKWIAIYGTIILVLKYSGYGVVAAPVAFAAIFHMGFSFLALAYFFITDAFSFFSDVLRDSYTAISHIAMHGRPVKNTRKFKNAPKRHLREFMERGQQNEITCVTATVSAQEDSTVRVTGWNSNVEYSIALTLKQPSLPLLTGSTLDLYLSKQGKNIVYHGHDFSIVNSHI